MTKEEIIDNILENCKQYFGTSDHGVQIVREFGGGKSGSRVFLIDVLDSYEATKNGRYVIKVCFEDTAEFFKEIVNTADLGNKQRSTCGICFPEYETSGHVEGTLYYIYDVAGSELNDTIQLSGSMTVGGSVLEQISKEILFGWNEKFRNRQVSIAECIREMVGPKRLDVGGRLSERIGQLIGDVLEPAYYYQNELLPNPYYFLINTNGPLGKNINAVIGNVHGDLNCKNVIVNKNYLNNNFEIYLIDYSHYNSSGFLFFDNAYLQLNLLLTGAAAANVFEWFTDIAALASTNGKKNHLIKYISDGVFGFINKCQPKNKDNCMIQYMSANIAAGLNWMNKSGNDKIMQVLCFLYASVYLKQLLIMLHYKFEIETDCKLTFLGGSKERGIWEILNHFNTVENRYILLTSCDTDTIAKEKFEAFAGVKWEVIFHVIRTASDEMGKYFLPKLKKKYGIQYKFLSEDNDNTNYEVVPTWCTIQTSASGNMKVWYRQNVQEELNKLLKAVLSMRENDPIYIIIDDNDWNYRILEEIITDIQVNAGKSLIHTICLNDSQVKLEADGFTSVEYTKYCLEDVASCAAITSKQVENRNVWLPKKGFDDIKREKWYLKDEEINYLSIDLELITQQSKWDDARGDAGEAFYHGADPSWEDIAEHRDIDRDDYVNAWKKDIEDKLNKLGTNVVNSMNLFHRAGAGGTTLSRRILWDFHTLFPCLILKKIGKETYERLKVIYNNTMLPILIIAEIRAGSITQIAINTLRIELINKGIRALFICVSRVNDIKIKQYSANLYLTSEPNMTMNIDECIDMFKAYSRMTSNDEAKKNLEMLTWGDREDWDELRQPFFYGLFAFGKEYSSISEFIDKSMENTKSNTQNGILALAFVTSYSQMGLKKTDLESIIGDESDMESFLNNPLIIRKSVGYQICHPVIAQYILNDKLDLKNDALGLLRYAEKFINMLTNIYAPDSKRLNDLLEEIFTHREYYVDEERYKFSTLVMELRDENKKKIFEYLIKKLPNNPHYYNHLARVYIYPSEKMPHTKIDFDKAVRIALKAIEKAEATEHEGVGIHHHLLGKINTKECKYNISLSKFRSPVMTIWKHIKPIYDEAEIEFNKSMGSSNVEYGLIGKMELISGIFNKFHQTKKSSIRAILEREPDLKRDFMELIDKMSRYSIEYTTKYGNDNRAYRNAMKDFYEALGNIAAIKSLLSMNGLTLKERLLVNRTLASLEILDGTGGKVSFYNMPEDRLQKVFDLIDANIKESTERNRHDCLMWFQAYIRMKSCDFGRAYDFLMDWPNGDNDYYVCFYRYVIGFILYYNNELDALTVQKHLKQSSLLANNLYGISTTSTREIIGMKNDKLYLIPDYSDSYLGNLNTEERDEYRKENGVFLSGQISDFSNAMVSIKFSIDGEFNFTAKIPAISDIGGMDVGDSVNFVLGFSYKEMRAWNIEKS